MATDFGKLYITRFTMENIELWAVKYNDVGCDFPKKKNSINIHYITYKCNRINIYRIKYFCI